MMVKQATEHAEYISKHPPTCLGRLLITVNDPYISRAMPHKDYVA